MSNHTHECAQPYTCDDCGTSYRYAIAAAMCCSPLNDLDDD